MKNSCLFRPVLTGLTLLLCATRAAAYVGLCCGKCGGNMPMNIMGGGIPETYEYRFKISPAYMHMDGLRDGTDSVSSGDLLGNPMLGKYMAVPTEMDMTMLNLTAGYSFTDRFFAGVMMMYRDNEMDMKFNSTMQMTTGEQGYTMESEGVGDTMLMSKYRLFADDPLIPKRQVSLLFSLSLPTGSINQENDNHPVPMRQDELLPYGMQLGSGTVDPSIGLLYQASSSPWWWGVNGSYTARLYDNDREYRLGDEFRLDGYLMHQFRPDLLVQFQLNGHYQGKIDGEMDAYADGSSGHAMQGNPASPPMTPLWDTDAYGGQEIFVSLGMQWQPAPFHILDFTVGLPVYQDLNGPQLETDYRVMLTWYIEVPTRKSIRYGIKNPQPPGNSALGF